MRSGGGDLRPRQVSLRSSLAHWYLRKAAALICQRNIAESKEPTRALAFNTAPSSK